MKIQFLFICFAFLFASCTKEHLTANGDIVNETRQPGNFTEIRSSGANNIHINYGTTFKVEVRGSSNLVSRYRTRVYNNTLELGYESASIRHDDVEVFITMPRISGVSLSGSGDVDMRGPFQNTDFFKMRISGSAKAIVYDEFDASSLDVNISGSGDADLEPIISDRADVAISGSGDTHLTALQLLDVTISGSGKVYYSGNPVVKTRISGSGQVIKN